MHSWPRTSCMSCLSGERRILRNRAKEYIRAQQLRGGRMVVHLRGEHGAHGVVERRVGNRRSGVVGVVLMDTGLSSAEVNAPNLTILGKRTAREATFEGSMVASHGELGVYVLLHERGLRSDIGITLLPIGEEQWDGSMNTSADEFLRGTAEVILAGRRDVKVRGGEGSVVVVLTAELPYCEPEFGFLLSVLLDAPNVAGVFVYSEGMLPADLEVSSQLGTDAVRDSCSVALLSHAMAWAKGRTSMAEAQPSWHDVAQPELDLLLFDLRRFGAFIARKCREECTTPRPVLDATGRLLEVRWVSGEERGGQGVMLQNVPKRIKGTGEGAREVELSFGCRCPAGRNISECELRNPFDWNIIELQNLCDDPHLVSMSLSERRLRPAFGCTAEGRSVLLLPPVGVRTVTKELVDRAVVVFSDFLGLERSRVDKTEFVNWLEEWAKTMVHDDLAPHAPVSPSDGWVGAMDWFGEEGATPYYDNLRQLEVPVRSGGSQTIASRVAEVQRTQPGAVDEGDVDARVVMDCEDCLASLMMYSCDSDGALRARHPILAMLRWCPSCEWKGMRGALHFRLVLDAQLAARPVHRLVSKNIIVQFEPSSSGGLLSVTQTAVINLTGRRTTTGVKFGVCGECVFLSLPAFVAKSGGKIRTAPKPGYTCKSKTMIATTGQWWVLNPSRKHGLTSNQRHLRGIVERVMNSLVDPKEKVALAALGAKWF